MERGVQRVTLHIAQDKKNMSDYVKGTLCNSLDYNVATSKHALHGFKDTMFAVGYKDGF